MIQNPHHIVARVLVSYYGLIQVVHFYVLARAAWVYEKSAAFGFPASPPPDGWQEHAVPLLLATGVVDALNVVLILLFVFAYFTQRWWWRPLGLVTFVISLYSAVMYLAAVVPAGVWRAHSNYWTVAAVFVPVLFLAILYMIWSAKRSFWQKL